MDEANLAIEEYSVLRWAPRDWPAHESKDYDAAVGFTILGPQVRKSTKLGQCHVLRLPEGTRQSSTCPEQPPSDSAVKVEATQEHDLDGRSHNWAAGR